MKFLTQTLFIIAIIIGVIGMTSQEEPIPEDARTTLHPSCPRCTPFLAGKTIPR